MEALYLWIGKDSIIDDYERLNEYFKIIEVSDSILILKENSER